MTDNQNSAENLIVTILCRRTQLFGTLITGVYFSLREALTRHDLTPGHVTVCPTVCAVQLGPVAPGTAVITGEDAAVVAGRRLAVVVGGVHAVRFKFILLFVGVVGSPRLAFRTIGCVGEGAGVDLTKCGVGVPARRS